VIVSAADALEARGVDADAVRRPVVAAAAVDGFDPDSRGHLEGELERRGWRVDRRDGAPGGYLVELERCADVDDVIVSHVTAPAEQAEGSALRAALAVLILGARSGR